LYPAQEHLLLQCSYDDKYDFNASTHRGIIGESLTRLGAMFSGKEYQILLPGEIHIKESGKREYKGRDSGLFMQPL
ncbi:lipid II-degrading bacteriocin, partial [Escherichia coli]